MNAQCIAERSPSLDSGKQASPDERETRQDMYLFMEEPCSGDKRMGVTTTARLHASSSSAFSSAAAPGFSSE